MTDPDQNDLPELELDLVDHDPVAEGTGEGAASPETGTESEAAETPPPGPSAVAAEGAPGAGDTATNAPADGDPEGGQWVWQFGAPAPPPSFGAAFFSGAALPELYRFFGCALLVVIGCLLPWGPATRSVMSTTADGTVQATDGLMSVPNVTGVETALGALSLIIGLWLLFSSCYSIYTRRQKILPVFLMIEPAIVSWMKLLETSDQSGSMGLLDMLNAAGTGVLLTLIGSTLVSIQFFFVVGKVYTKKDDKGASRRASKGGAKKSKAGEGADSGAADKKASGAKGKRSRKKS